MDDFMTEFRTKVGHAMGSGQILGINPMEKETIELLKEQGYDFTPYIIPPQEEPNDSTTED